METLGNTTTLMLAHAQANLKRLRIQHGEHFLPPRRLQDDCVQEAKSLDSWGGGKAETRVIQGLI